uniref:Uncharacterized protein n=1 Tax=Euplotes harpa TaxID=151035 RepID=A0A7S3JG97_9SPIT|mmetsp:Transcript_39206/g.44917  ORF Transcript_39206/g.44917 Transcript_39206/m.44917 type:complete len:333 (+) Transcript_39206:126-1124(+)
MNEARDGTFTPDFTKGGNEDIKNDQEKTQELLKDLNTLVKQVTTREKDMKFGLERKGTRGVTPINSLNKTKTNAFNSLNTMVSTTSSGSKRQINKRETREVISQLVNMQREMIRDKSKNKNNYDSDDSESDNEGDNKGDEDVLEHKRGVICLPRVGDLVQNNFHHTDIDNIQEADDDSEAEVEAEPKCPNSEKIFSNNKNCALNMKFFVHSNNGQKHKSKKLNVISPQKLCGFSKVFGSGVKNRLLKQPYVKRTNATISHIKSVSPHPETRNLHIEGANRRVFSGLRVDGHRNNALQPLTIKNSNSRLSKRSSNRSQLRAGSRQKKIKRHSD